MRMAMTDLFLKIEEEHVVQSLREAAEKLDGADGEAILDFSSVHRIDPSALRGLKEFAGRADDKRVKATLRDVNVDIYRVLKLVKLASRFSFVN